MAIVAFLVWEFNRRINKLERLVLSLELRLGDKVNKPNDFDKWAEEHKKKPFLSKEELEKEKHEAGEI